MAPTKRGSSIAVDANDEPPSEKKKQKSANDDDDGPFESDDELPEESAHDHLSWRKDKDCSFSDWTIIIKVPQPPCDEKDQGSDESSKQQEYKEFTYHVHKLRLAVGPRRSGYFVRLFQNDFTESQDNTSRIELNSLGAKAFPELLDYIYSSCQKTSFRTKTATALYSLAKYFDVRRLRHEVKQFCNQDMQASAKLFKCCTFYEHAKILQEDSILQAATKFFHDNINRKRVIYRNWLRVTDPPFWLDLLEEKADKDVAALCIVSQYIARFCEAHENLSPDFFKQLTDEQYLPEGVMSCGSAVRFLVLEHKILGEEDGNDQGELTNLQLRCINSIVLGKEVAQFNGAWKELLPKMRPRVLHEIITRLVHGIPQPEAPEEDP